MKKKIVYDSTKYTGAKKKKLNTKKIEKFFPNYKKDLMNINEGLKETIEWYKDNLKF